MKGEIDAALALHRRALTIRQGVNGKASFAVAIAHAALGDSLYAAGQLGDALQHFNASLVVGKPDVAKHYHCARYWHRTGVVLQAMGDMQKAHIHFLKALEFREQLVGAEHPATAAAHHTIGKLMQDMGRQREALASYRKALAIVEKSSYPDAQIYRAAIAALGKAGAPAETSATDAVNAAVAAKPTPATTSALMPATQTALPGDADKAVPARADAISPASLLPRSMTIDTDAGEGEGDSDGDSSKDEGAETGKRSRQKCAVM